MTAQRQDTIRWATAGFAAVVAPAVARVSCGVGSAVEVVPNLVWVASDGTRSSNEEVTVLKKRQRRRIKQVPIGRGEPQMASPVMVLPLHLESEVVRHEFREATSPGTPTNLALGVGKSHVDLTGARPQGLSAM